MKQKITIKQIAELAGTSVSTVSRVLSNPWYPVAESTRERVANAVKNSNYENKSYSRYSKKSPDKDIGVIFPNLSNPFYSQVLLGIERELRGSGFNVLVFNSLRDSNHEYNLLKSMQEKEIKAVILSSVIMDSKWFRRFTNLGMKLIFLDQKVDDMENHILFEYKAGAAAAIKYLYELGHRNFCLATTPLTRWSRKEIVEGYKKAHEELALEYNANTLLLANNKWEGEVEETVREKIEAEEINYDIKSGVAKARELLSRRLKATAVLCVNDMVAFGLIKELHKHQIKVPRDISVIGFDDIPFAAMFTPALTTVRCPAIEIGQFAAQQAKESVGSNFDITLSARLIVRESTAKV
jgi:LacI family transcriptional regulator